MLTFNADMRSMIPTIVAFKDSESSLESMSVVGSRVGSAASVDVFLNVETVAAMSKSKSAESILDPAFFEAPAVAAAAAASAGAGAVEATGGAVTGTAGVTGVTGATGGQFKVCSV